MQKARLGSRMSVNAARPARFSSRSRSPLMKHIILSGQERRDLIFLMKTLTGMRGRSAPEAAGALPLDGLARR